MQIIRAINVSKQFEIEQNVVHALRETTLSVSAGESIALVGNSGAGKSTLLHILGALEQPTSGEVYFGEQRLDGVNNGTIRHRYRRDNVGFVFQFHHLVAELTAKENIMLPLRMQRRGYAEASNLADEWLSKVGLADRAEHRPSELSGGEQQRIAVARALVRNPDVVFADEPTGNLDDSTGKAIGDLMLSLCKSSNTALIVVTHNQELAAQMDRQEHMRDGSLV